MFKLEENKQEVGDIDLQVVEDTVEEPPKPVVKKKKKKPKKKTNNKTTTKKAPKKTKPKAPRPQALTKDKQPKRLVLAPKVAKSPANLRQAAINFANLVKQGIVKLRTKGK